MTGLPDSNPSRRQLEERWRELLDWADENDDEGGHVGFSRYYREQARLIEERLPDSNPSKCPNGPDENGDWPCDPIVYGTDGIATCSVCGFEAPWPDSDRRLPRGSGAGRIGDSRRPLAEPDSFRGSAPFKPQPAASRRGVHHNSPAVAPPATVWSGFGPDQPFARLIVPFCRGFVVRMRGLEPFVSGSSRYRILHHLPSPSIEKPRKCGAFHMKQASRSIVLHHRPSRRFGPDLVRDGAFES